MMTETQRDMLMAVHGDMTKLVIDAVVRVANSKQGDAILASGGVKLRDAAAKFGALEAGQVRLTRGFDLPAGHVIHTVWPVWRGGLHFETELLAASYTNALRLAAEQGMKTVAFPGFGSREFAHPHEARIAMSAVTDFFNAPFGALRQIIFCVENTQEAKDYDDLFARFYRRTVYMSGEMDVDIKNPAHMNELCRIVRENPGISTDEINQKLKEKFHEQH